MKKDSKIIKKGVTRRKFLKGLAASGAAAAIKPPGLFGGTKLKSGRQVSVCIFSKHLQWLDYDGMAETAAELGFDGVALTVRRGGHVLPDSVEDHLPKAAEAVKKAGIKIPMMVTNINNPDDPNTEKILRTASKLGINHYRLGYNYYNEKSEILDQLKEIKSKMRDLAAMNEEYKIFGGNPNSNANAFASSIWDEWQVFKDIDSKWIGYQFDVTHAIQEGGGGSWQTDARLIAERIGILSLNAQAEWADPEWKKSTEKTRGRKWNFPTPYELNWIFTLLKKTGFSGPISLHYEFDGLGGAEKGSREIKGISKNDVLNIFQRSLKILRGMLKKTVL